MDIQPTSIVCFEEKKDAFYEQDIDLFNTFGNTNGFIRKVHDGELEVVGLPVRGKHDKKRITHVLLSMDGHQLRRQYKSWEDMRALKQQFPALDLRCTVMALSDSSGLAPGRSFILRGRLNDRLEKLLCIALGAMVACVTIHFDHLYTLWDLLTPPY